jgi:membrane protease YdiL (CAAX protease family)
MNPDPPVSVLPAEESANTHRRSAAERIWGLREDNRTDLSEVTPPEQWRQESERQIAQAEAEGYHDRARRLRGFGSWQGVAADTILLVLVEIVVSFMLAGVALGVLWLHGNYLAPGVTTNTALNRATTDLTNWLSSPTGLGLSALVTQGSIFLILQLRVVGRGVMSWQDIGFGPVLRNRPGRAFLIGLGIGLAAFVIGEVLLATMHAVGLPVNGQQDELASVRHTRILPFLFFAFTASITAPIAEESFFRAYALRALTVRYGFPVGVAISSLFFGLLHLTGGVGLVFVPLIVIGALLAWGYGRTGNPITNITAHALNNLIGVILLLTGS